MKQLAIASALVLLLGSCKQTTAKKELTIQPQEASYVSLFDGVSFNGWHSYLGGQDLNGWTIEDGAMVFDPELKTKEGSANLVTDQEFTNFELMIDWKISEGGNSGIMWSVVEDQKYSEPYLTGPEIQVLDDAKHPDSFVGEGTHKAGALYDMIAPIPAVKPAMEWNHCVIRINHHTNEGAVQLNGVTVVNFPVHGEEWKSMVAQSKFANWDAFGVSQTGKIALQDHGNKVWFKNIQIKSLD